MQIVGVAKIGYYFVSFRSENKKVEHMNFLMLNKFGVVIYENLINQTSPQRLLNIWRAILISKTIMSLVA